jgi:hypothetical protein
VRSFIAWCTESNRFCSIHEILIDDVTRGLQGVILGDHRFTTLVRGISSGLTKSATLLFASARHTSTISLQLDDEGVFWRFPGVVSQR